MMVAFWRVADSSCQLCSAHFFQLKTLYEELSCVPERWGEAWDSGQLWHRPAGSQPREWQAVACPVYVKFYSVSEEYV